MQCFRFRRTATRSKCSRSACRAKGKRWRFAARRTGCFNSGWSGWRKKSRRLTSMSGTICWERWRSRNRGSREHRRRLSPTNSSASCLLIMRSSYRSPSIWTPWISGSIAVAKGRVSNRGCFIRSIWRQSSFSSVKRCPGSLT